MGKKSISNNGISKAWARSSRWRQVAGVPEVEEEAKDEAVEKAVEKTSEAPEVSATAPSTADEVAAMKAAREAPQTRERNQASIECVLCRLDKLSKKQDDVLTTSVVSRAEHCQFDCYRVIAADTDDVDADDDDVVCGLPPVWGDQTFADLRWRMKAEVPGRTLFVFVPLNNQLQRGRGHFRLRDI